ncbi:MAG: hypothetical protein VYC03_05205, partial [Pseudomonadota bacterium]|nr:hypothetical protein [Pseudomonadota bacterium]
DLGGGNDFVQVKGDAGVYVDGGAGNDHLYGATGDDQLVGGSGDDVLTGNIGDDTLEGGAGHDFLSGGAGSDMLEGGDGNDTYSISETDLNDTVIERANGGIDTVYSALETTTLWDNVEELYLSGELSVTGIGSATDNEIFGNANDNILSGGLGDDILRGGEGYDVATFLGDASDYAINLATMTVTDLNVANGNEGTDTLYGIEALRFDDGAELTVSVTDTGEFMVNANISGDQHNPSVSAYGDGNFVTTWYDENRDDVYAQNYNILGDPIGGEYRVNTHTGHTQRNPEVTSLNDGSYVITWGSRYQDAGSSYGVYGQHYSASGEPQGGEFQIHTTIDDDQYDPSIASLDDGGFVVTWRDDNGATDGREGSGVDVFGQRFDANSVKVGDEFLINADADTGSQYEPSVAGLGNGQFVVTWRDSHGSSHDKSGDDATTGSGEDVRAQIFTTKDANGDALTTPVEAGSDFRVNDATYHTQYAPSVADLSDGGFIVTYASYYGDQNHSYAIMGQRYDAAGSPVGDEMPIVSDYISNHQYTPSVTGLADGGFVVTWYNEGSSDVRGQIYNADGTPLNDEFRVNTYDSSTQNEPSVTALVDGGFVVTWQDSSGHSGGSSYDIRAQRFSADGTKGVATPLGEDLNSSFTFTGVDDYSLINLGDGIDTITLTGTAESTFFVSGTEYVYAGGGADVVTVAGDEGSNVFGEGGDDRLFGNNAGSLLDGGSGEDVLIGGSGSDTLVGGSGNDVLNAGSGM